jgi:hypothetical protein
LWKNKARQSEKIPVSVETGIFFRRIFAVLSGKLCSNDPIISAGFFRQNGLFAGW